MNRACLIAMSAVLAIAALPLSYAQDQQDEAQAAQVMEQLQARIQAMQEQMARIQSTEDPEQRQQLMQEHMQTLRESMGMMGQMMQRSMGQGPRGGQCPPNDTACQLNRMQVQQRMMGQRMGMMQQMMQQMIEGMDQTYMMRGRTNEGQ